MMVEAHDLVIKRGGTVVVRAVSFALAAGECLALIGANGCGKSTVLGAVAGLWAPHRGQVRIAGADVWGTSTARDAARRQLGYVPEHADAPGFLTSRELWQFTAGARGGTPPTEMVAQALGLAEIADARLATLSLGQRRRACLAAALAGPPGLLVLDEPDNGLDAARLLATQALLRRFCEGGGAILLASHDARFREALGARELRLDTQA